MVRDFFEALKRRAQIAEVIFQFLQRDLSGGAFFGGGVKRLPNCWVLVVPVMTVILSRRSHSRFL